MSDVVKVAAEQIETALKTVEDVRVYRDPSATIDPPGVVIGPPRLQWETPCDDPSSATFPLYLVVDLDDRVLEKFWTLLPAVAKAIGALPDAAVTRADSGVFNANGQDLPCYEITTEVAL